MIPEELLQTKLQIPRRRPSVVARPRLIDLLNGALESRLILISAPAGFGKTTLLTEWLAGTRYLSAWLSVDRNDNRPSLFLAYLVAALQKVRPSLGEGSLGLVNSAHETPLEPVLVSLINEIGSLSEHIILVIDDYHTIENTGIHKAISFLIDNLPANIHLIISGRYDPPLNLAHLRGRGQLTELRADDLRFTTDEIADFLNRVMALDLAAEHLALLGERSEGWIAGLQMAALSLKRHSARAAIFRAIASTNRDILDYLFEEVFAQQAPEVQSFLLETSILDRLSPSLCEAVTESKDGGQILDKIEKANLFVSPLDDELRWYRYHPLFKDLLQHSLSITRPEMVPVLHRRASQWYEQEDLIAQAISHAVDAKDFDRAAHLIERRAGELSTQGEWCTYLGWMTSFPDSIVKMYPILLVHRLFAETLASGLPVEDTDARLQEIEKLDPEGRLKGVLMVVRAVSSRSHHAELCQQALKLLPPELTYWRDIALANAVQSLPAPLWFLEGDIPNVSTAISLYGETYDNARKHGLLFTMALSLLWIGETYTAGGRLHQAQGYYEQVLNLAVDKRGQFLPIAAFGLFGLGTLHREWNNAEKSIGYFERSAALAGGKIGHWQIGYIVELARARQARGDLELASGFLQRARQLLAIYPGFKHHASAIAAGELGLARARGDLDKVGAWAHDCDAEALIKFFQKEAELPQYIPGYWTRETDLLTLARADLALGRPAEALRLLAPVSMTAERLGRAGVVLEANILCSLACGALGDAKTAMSHLRRALEAAEPEGYVRLFLDEAPAIASLLYEAARQGITPAYTHQLIAALPVSHSPPGRPAKAVKMEEPLSERELGVLRLIAIGLSNKEIGERLHIETRTVKWHTSNIFGKMGVKNRIQAVARARELGVIAPDSDPRATDR